MRRKELRTGKIVKLLTKYHVALIRQMTKKYFYLFYEDLTQFSRIRINVNQGLHIQKLFVTLCVLVNFYFFLLEQLLAIMNY